MDLKMLLRKKPYSYVHFKMGHMGKHHIVVFVSQLFHQFFRRVDTFVRQAMDGFYR